MFNVTTSFFHKTKGIPHFFGSAQHNAQGQGEDPGRGYRGESGRLNGWMKMKAKEVTMRDENGKVGWLSLILRQGDGGSVRAFRRVRASSTELGIKR